MECIEIPKLLLKEISKVGAVKFIKTPLPDYEDVYPDDLPY